MDFVIFLEQKITISMGNALFIGIWAEIENVRYDSESKCIFERLRVKCGGFCGFIVRLFCFWSKC